MPHGSLIAEICQQNLDVYRASITRLREDVAGEGEIAHDYRGRIVYELLQNADDAMADAPTHEDAVWIRLTETDLWVGNSGRAIDDGDVRGLCGTGASSKGAAVGRRRASIGHKGMGFKSVLEITEAPQVISADFAFRLGRDLARGPIEALMNELGKPPPERVPAMRFPAPLPELPKEWELARSNGVKTLFRFPLRTDIDATRKAQLAERLLGLPVTAMVFLKNLEHISVQVSTKGHEESIEWKVTRERQDDVGWSGVTGLSEPGIYRITVETGNTTPRRFLVAHDNELEISTYRGGLDEYAWAGIELTEVAVAAELDGELPVPQQRTSQVLHVFLPTGEASPYSVLINGAFSADLSRQKILVSEDADDYNGWLLRQAAQLFSQELAPALLGLGASEADVLTLLDRGAAIPNEPAASRTAEVLVSAMRDVLSRSPAVPLPSGERVPVSQCALPPQVDDELAGTSFRGLLAEDARFDDRGFPLASLCGGRPAFVLADHGAQVLAPADAPRVLAGSHLDGVRLEEHESGGVYVDPVLRVLEGLWAGLPSEDRGEFASAVRAVDLLPVDIDAHGAIRRTAVGERDCFYPPRALNGSVPLDGLCFIAREICWGALLPKERQEYLRDQMAAWQALFGVRDFKFPDVMRSSVLPALTLPDDGERTAEWDGLRSPVVLAAICQLSGRTPNPTAPLPYERLGPNRALFNLSRLPVPCKSDVEGEYSWEPAYKVYFGEDWIGAASIEHILSTIEQTGAEAPNVPMLVAPKELVPLLDRYKHLRGAADDPDDGEADPADEVELDEDEDAALDGSDQDRWLSFLTWLGVNRVLRPTHFTDVEDRGAGWLTTKGLSKPRGWAFHDLPDELWQPFEAAARAQLTADELEEHDAYFYGAHDLEYAAEILGYASQDASCTVGCSLFVHLVENWPQLQRFARVEVAVVAAGVSPGRRAVPRAQDNERRELGENFWLWRLRNRDFCPTSRGPKKPADTWVRTRELDRRFSSTRGKIDCTHLLPVLDIPAPVAAKAQPLVMALGVRDEITPSSLRPQDAHSILKQLERIYREGPARRDIREVIRPAYRSLIELLPGQSGDERFPPGVLSDAPLLETNGHDQYRFAPAADVLWAERNGTRERLGNPSKLWTFVHESSTNARLPLTELFDVRVLEEQLVWSPIPGAEALDEIEIARFRDGLAEVAPYILSRLSADRTTEALQRQDASTLRDLIEVLLPVESLRVSCQLDGVTIAQSGDRAAFVDLQEKNGTRAFVTWGDCAWPPSPIEAEALATALSEALGATNFEAFFALINAQDAATRERMLSLAGAPNDLDGARAALGDEQAESTDADESSLDLEKEVGQRPDETPAKPPTTGHQQTSQPMTPLYGAEQLLIGGVPVVISGQRKLKAGSAAPRRHSGGNGSGTGNGGGYGGRTDLGELDRLGMYIAMGFERNRLVQAGDTAEIFDPESEEDQRNARVFDVSSPARITRARDCSTAFANAVEYMTARGVDPAHPGCDIVTLGTRPEEPVDRLIELKSSGVHARTQAMTWNEWKTAKSDALRSHFYLYLAGNLRSDLPDARPFLRAVRDPYESMRTQEMVETAQTRRVVLYVSEFNEADELTLGVTATS